MNSDNLFKVEEWVDTLLLFRIDDDDDWVEVISLRNMESVRKTLWSFRFYAQIK
jgi:hypothetical protein